MIRLLQESMPGTEIETVTLGENIDHPLDAVLAQVDRSKTGPVMIVGLERSNPSSAKERPVLYALNMSRPEWPQELSRPLVFWVPEYLLGLMGREAPDFLDWRSDTLFFPVSLEEELLPLKPEVWLGEPTESLSERKRRARIEELKTRLEAYYDPDDPTALAARSAWFKELGVHFYRLADWNAASKNSLAALEIERKLGRQEKIAELIGNLALLDQIRGKVEKAENALQRALEIYQAQGNLRGEVISLANLASLHLRSGRLETAEKLGRQALGLARADALNLWPLTPSLIGGLLGIALGVTLGKKDFNAAKKLAEEALAAAAAAGRGFQRPEALRNQGILSLAEGDLDRAEGYFKESLRLARMLGDPISSAEALLGLGLLYIRGENEVAARDVLVEAEKLFRDTGDHTAAEKARARLRELGAPSLP